MTITVAKLKRAVEDCAEAPGLVTFQRIAFEQLCQDPTMLTLLAEKLSERPDWRTCTRAEYDAMPDAERRMPLPGETDDDYQRRASGT